MNQLKRITLYCAKFLGLFIFARYVTRHGLRILCYHGFSFGDEHLFRPKLFIKEATFKRRLNKVARMGFSVVSLDHAVQSLKNGVELESSLVFTIDDGWQGVADIAEPLFAKHQFCWCLYLTTYYAEKQTQIMNVAIHYLLWKTKQKYICLRMIDVDGESEVHFADTESKEALASRLIQLGESFSTAEERQAFVRKIALLLDVNQALIEESRLFHLLSMASVKKLHEKGADIQLHTHRHSLGEGGQEKIGAEILENRRLIESVCQNRAVHFCYPSGEYRKDDLKYLTDFGVLSATTCKPGFNYKSTSLLELGRFLDGENISQIEFEAELSGFFELLRRCRRGAKAWWKLQE